MIVRTCVALAMLILLAGCVYPHSKEPAILESSELEQLSDGYYALGSDVVRLENRRRGGLHFIFPRSKISYRLLALPVRAGVWMLQFNEKDNEKEGFFYLVMRSSPEQNGYTLLHLTNCGQGVANEFSRIAGHIKECKFLRPDGVGLAQVLDRQLPAVQLEAPERGRSVKNVGSGGAEYDVVLLQKLPERAGALLWRQKELEGKDKDSKR